MRPGSYSFLEGTNSTISNVVEQWQILDTGRYEKNSSSECENDGRGFRDVAEGSREAMAGRCYDEFRYCSRAGKDCSTRDSSDEEPLDLHWECAPTGGSNAWPDTQLFPWNTIQPPFPF